MIFLPFVELVLLQILTVMIVYKEINTYYPKELINRKVDLEDVAVIELKRLHDILSAIQFPIV
jgi:hypothetical protein